MEQGKLGSKGLSGGSLKIIAIVAMLIDHTAAILMNGDSTLYFAMRLIGRLGFPIFCFLLVEGFVHTSNVKKYAVRLGIFAMISEVPFDLAFNNRAVAINYQNVFFTLFIGLLVLIGVKKFENNKIGYTIIILLGCATAWLLKTDYNLYGVLIILFFYLYRTNPIFRGIFVELMCIAMGNIEPFAGLALIPIQLYNGERGIRLKYLFYAFYPVHIFILYLIRIFC